MHICTQHVYKRKLCVLLNSKQTQTVDANATQTGMQLVIQDKKCLRVNWWYRRLCIPPPAPQKKSPGKSNDS